MASRSSPALSLSGALGLSLCSAAVGAFVATSLVPVLKRRRRRRAVGSPLPKVPGAGSCIYLDVNATCPIYPDVADASAPFFREFWGNPSSPHAYGRPCKEAITKAREQVASMLNASADEIIFCGCGSEADNWSILGALELGAGQQRRHIVTTSIEHPAILVCIDALVKAGKCDVTIVPCDNMGYVAVDAVVSAVKPGVTALVTIMLANNEVGSVQNIGDMSRRCKERDPGLLFHTDAAQACGKIAVNVESMGVDLCTIVGHKYGAPKGVAALYVRKGVALPSMIKGGGQESGRRAGTECAPLIVALGEASAIWNEQQHEIQEHMGKMRDMLQSRLVELLGEQRIRVNCLPAKKDVLPNTLSIGIKGVAASKVLEALSESVAASAGAACHASATSVSQVLQAMDVPLEYAKGTLRLSVGRHTTADEVQRAAALIAAQCQVMF